MPPGAGRPGRNPIVSEGRKAKAKLANAAGQTSSGSRPRPWHPDDL